MQGGSVFDDIAERVLRYGRSLFVTFSSPCPNMLLDPNDDDAKYVHFFHEKIPSRYVNYDSRVPI